ncbi:MAG TPA: hypothetical protein VGH65_09795 [Verrucomicrobiaceae bacterium]|jgi:hypothetical protein
MKCRAGAWVVAMALLAGAVRVPAQEQPAAAATVGPNQALTPGDFLDNVGKQAKARWRQLYRAAPPAAPSERLRVAFMLGALVGDSYLAQKAGDAQQFKNTNQDLINYCRVLGMGEKVTPGFLAAAKAAEREDWPAVRKLVSESEGLIERLLIEQRDEELATLVTLGMWMRLFEITTSIVMNDEDNISNKTLCIGSIPLLTSLEARFEKLSQDTRDSDAIARLGTVLDVLQRHWENTNGHPGQDVIDMTSEKLNFLMTRLTQR